MPFPLNNHLHWGASRQPLDSSALPAGSD